MEELREHVWLRKHQKQIAERDRFFHNVRFVFLHPGSRIDDIYNPDRYRFRWNENLCRYVFEGNG